MDGPLSFSDTYEIEGIAYQRKRGANLQQFHDHTQPEQNPDWEMTPIAIISRIGDRYRDYASKRKIILQKGDQYAKIPYTVRGSKSYTDASKKRLARIREDWDLVRYAMKVCIAPRAIGSMWRIHKDVKKLWPRFMDWFRRRFQPDIYTWSMEPTKRHYSHYHLVSEGRHPKGLMAQEILHWWQGHGVDIENPGVQVDYADGSQAVDYAVKYVEKGCNDMLWQTIMWMSRGRMWGVSRGLGRGGGEINSATNEWTYIGVMANEDIIRAKRLGIDLSTYYDSCLEEDRPPPWAPPETSGSASRAKKFL